MSYVLGSVIKPQERTWFQIREELKATYGKWYPAKDLRASEIKWRRICAEVGWSVKGQ